MHTVEESNVEHISREKPELERSHSEPRKYLGRGTHDEPYVVDWDADDVENPYNWPKRRKWAITFQVSEPVICDL